MKNDLSALRNELCVAKFDFNLLVVLYLHVYGQILVGSVGAAPGADDPVPAV